MLLSSRRNWYYLNLLKLLVLVCLDAYPEIMEL